MRIPEPRGVSAPPGRFATVGKADVLAVELIKPDGTLQMILIVWPSTPTPVEPRRLAEMLARIMRVLATAQIEDAARRALLACNT